MIIIDTNVISELLRPEPDGQVEAWLAGQDGSLMYFTAIGEAELRYGVAILPAGKRRSGLLRSIEGILDELLRDRVLPFDRPAATVYAEIAAMRRSAGRPISQFDGQIAAIARSHGASLATRNTADFEGCGIEVLNPWLAKPLNRPPVGRPG